MLSLNNIKATNGSRKNTKRVGRGNGSKGTFSGRGMNGQNSRSGGGVAPWFEGGQTPLFRRMPKLKGFTNAKFKKEYNIITFRDLELLSSKGVSDINFETLLANKMISNKKAGVKLIAKGEIKGVFNVIVDKATKTSIFAVEKAGGSIKIKNLETSSEDIKIKPNSKEVVKEKTIINEDKNDIK